MFLSTRFLIIFLSLLLITPVVFSDYETSFVRSTTSSSDILDKFDLLYENQKMDISYPYERRLGIRKAVGVGIQKGITNKKNFSGQSIYWQLGKELMNNVSLEGDLTYSSLKSDFDLNLTKSSLFPSLTFKSLIEPVYLLLSAKDYFLYQDLVFPGSISDNIIGHEGLVSIAYRINEKFRLNSKWRHIDFSDTNYRDVVDLAFLYGISPGTPWIWAGVNGSSWNHKWHSPDYWSPMPYTNYGLIIESSIPISGFFSIDASGNIFQFKEDSEITGSGNYYSLALQYGNRNSSFCRLAYERGNSFPHNSDSSYYDNLSLKLHLFQ